MDVDDRRTPDAELGRQVATGRDATLHDAGPGRLLRRMAGNRDLTTEAAVMAHVRAAGYAVPEVFRVGPGEMVIERVEGPTMLDDLAARPWRVDRHAATLAALHRSLHAIDPPPGLRPHPVGGDAVLHLDLHPGNVICAPDGPVVIDWTNACRGDPAADVALTWLLMAAAEIDDVPAAGPALVRLRARAERMVTPLLRRRLVATFLRHAGRDEARRVLAATADHRLIDPNLRPAEAAAIRELVAREVSPAGGGR
ncbi:MAG TPA: phosphotransferase [Aquihabitans sp.]|nr:phosphotransferase [Aquihabitans sp.]